MKKILLVAADGFSKTGVPTVFMNIVRNLSRYGFQFDIIYFEKQFNYFFDEFCSYGGKTFLFDKQYRSTAFRKVLRYFSGRRYYKKTLATIKDNGPYDAIHCFKEYRSCYFLKAAKKAGVPIRIYHSNNTIKIAGNIINRFLMKRERKQCLNNMTKLIGCSHNSCLSAFGNDFKHSVINNPYDESAFYFDEQSQTNSGILEISQTAGFCAGKNQLFALDVLSAIKLEQKQILLHFIGMDIDPKYRALVDRKIEEQDLKNNVIFHDCDANQKEIFDRCCYFLLPSLSEAFGIVLIEAQACGVKCFASDVTPAEVNVGGCVRLPLSLGPKKWAEKILDDYKINRGRKRRYDCSAFSSSTIIENYKKIYEEGLE